ncbi:hypothetical protein E2C01_016611 [Portunus trituberculatus]|uniref:Uncharacterized protein n=1 Tax=Portunus trituberculatus TaxID=210409 RepID=A0A5B7DRK5_PORTR|nr:hypothetical protein [Portunus trituberculatus]
MRVKLRGKNLKNTTAWVKNVSSKEGHQRPMRREDVISLKRCIITHFSAARGGCILGKPQCRVQNNFGFRKRPELISAF